MKNNVRIYHAVAIALFCGVNGVSAQVKQDIVSEPVTVFEPGSAYTTTRIPAIVATKKGTLLAFCEARANSTSDWAEIDLIMRRSTNGGRSWGPVVVIVPREKNKPLGNPTPIVDQEGRIHLL